MATIIILDDEEHCTKVLATLIERLDTQYTILGVYNNPEHALEYVKSNPPDILFLDIEMPKLNGFQFLDKLFPINFDVIFTTAFDQYAIKAFEYSAINYLQKPISERSIVKALSNWENRRQSTTSAQWELLRSSINTPKKDQTRMALPTGVGYDIIEIKDIIRCKSDNNYTYFYFEGGSKILVSRTLKEIEALLQGQGFFRIHQSHLINAKFVKNISRQDGGLLVMSDGVEVPVSRQKKGQIKEILESMLRFK